MNLFSTYRAKDPAAVEVVGQPKAQWVQRDETVLPILMGDSGFSIWFHSAPIANGIFSGAYSLVDGEGHPQGSSTAHVVFRVKVADSSLERQQILFEGELDGPISEAQPVDVPLPDQWPSGYIGIQAEYLAADTEVSAAWIDPRVSFSSPQVDPSLPNILLVTADTTRRDDLGPYAGSAATSILDALASEGVVFHNAFTVATGTTPSHSSLFTASHSRSHGVYDNRTPLRADRLSLAEVLSDMGFETAAFVSAVPVSSVLGLSQGFELYDDFLGGRRARGAEETTARFLEWLDRRVGGPFFSWIHYFDPHQPYAPPAEYMPSAPSRRIARFFEDEQGRPRHVEPWDVVDAGFDLEVFGEYARSRYRGEIAHMDAELGRIVQQLQDQGLYDDTLVVFTADHGENFLEQEVRLAFDHDGLFDGVVHVPLIIKFPEARHAGLSIDELVGSIDIAPTILAELGHEVPEAWEGKSVLGFIGNEGRREPFRRALVIEGARHREVSIRSRQWMYREIRAPYRSLPRVMQNLGYRGMGRELYDLLANPSETRNVYAEQQATSLVEQLEEFKALASPLDRIKVESQEHLDALRALGYVQ